MFHHVRTTAARRAAAIVLCVALPIVVVGGGGAATATPGGKDPGVTVSVSPQRLEVLPRPCLPARLTVALQSLAAGGAYATATIRVAAPLRVSRDMYTTFVPADRQATMAIDVVVPGDTPPGTYHVVVESGRERVSVPVVVSPPAPGPNGNLAYGQLVTASSTFPRLAPPCGPVDGDYTYTFLTYSRPATAWADDSPGEFPDRMEVRLAEPAEVGRIDLYTDAQQQFALKDWDLHLMTSAGWQTVAQVRGHTSGRHSATFPPVTASAVRVDMLATNGYAHSIVTELEVYAR